MATLDRRDALKLLGSLGVAGALAACGSSGGSSSPQGQVTVGLVVPQSGPLAKIGAEMTAGFQLYLQMHGQVLGGVPVGLNLVDEGPNPQTALAAVKAGIAAGATVLVGVANTESLLGIRDTVNSAHVPLIGTRGVLPSPPFRASDYIWQAGYVVGESGTSMGTYLSSINRFRRLLVWSDGSTESQAEVTALTGNFTGVSNVLNAPDGPSGAEIRNGIEQFNPDVVYAAYTGNAALAFIKAYRAQGPTAVLAGPGTFTEGPVLASMPANAKGILTTMPYGPDIDNITNRAFINGYTTSKFAGVGPEALPTMYSMAAYDAALVLDRAIRLIDGSVNAGSINRALAATTTFDSPRGQWSFNQPRSPRQRWYLRELRRDGGTLANLTIQQVGTLS